MCLGGAPKPPKAVAPPAQLPPPMPPMSPNLGTPGRGQAAARKAGARKSRQDLLAPSAGMSGLSIAPVVAGAS